MEIRQLFPLGKAYGEAFCNRQEEIKQLAGNIQAGKHSLLLAPRRYGKSSLAEKVITVVNLPSATINFHLCTSETELADLVLDKVTKLIGSAIGHLEKLMTSVKKYLTNLEPLLSFGNDIATLKLMPKQHVNHALIITEALLLIEHLLQEKNKRAVLFLDEFQEIVYLSKHHHLEGAFRTAAQEMQHLAIIFSGSMRSLLVNMFEDEHRPLYKLCRKMKLDLITATAYEKHIQKIAYATWGKYLTKKTMDKINQLSHCHPYYMNYLCDCIWQACKKLPNATDVIQAWNKVIAEEWRDGLKELADLSLSQRRVIKYLANQEVTNLQSHETTTKLAMPASTIASAINALLEKDYIEQTATGVYWIISPLLLSILQGATE